MPTLKEIKEQIAKLPADARHILGTEKEVRALPKVLEKGEPIRALTSGFVGSDTWLMVCTDRRIIFIDRGWLYGTKQIQMPLSRINSIDHEIGIAFGSISVWDGATRVTVGTILRGKVDYFVRCAKKSMEEYNYRMSAYAQQQAQQQQQYQPQPQQQAAAPQRASNISASDLATHLERLAELRDRKVLTEEEFQIQKARILGQQ